MQLSELLERAKTEIEEEDQEMATETIKEHLREIRITKRLLNKMETKFQTLLKKSVEEIADLGEE